MGGRLGIWEVWFPDRGGVRVFGDGPEPGFVVALIGSLIGGLPVLCFFAHRSTIHETTRFLIGRCRLSTG
jgi:hypothetical protein